MDREHLTQRAAAVRRLWRPRDVPRIAVPLALALIALAVDARRTDLPTASSKPATSAIHFGLIFAAALLAVYAVRSFIFGLSEALDSYLGMARARSLATFTSVILYAIIVLFVIGAVGPNLNGVLVGGAVTGVIVGIAGQTSLANIIAGLVLLFARPFSAGMYVTTRTGAFGGAEYSGQVWDVSLFYTTLHNNMYNLEVRIPNSVMINAVVVQRPAEHEVYIPITLPKATEDVPAILERLRATIVERMKGEATPYVTLESVTDAGYVVGVRAFVANPNDRQVIESAVARIVAEIVQATAVPAQPAEQELDETPPDTGARTGDVPATTEEQGRRMPVASRAP